VSAEVAAGSKAFERLLELDTQRMAEGMRVLAANADFREAITSNDANALTPMLAKAGKGIGAPLMMLVGVDHRIVASTVPAEVGRRTAFPKLLDRASAAQQSWGHRADRRPALSARDRPGDGAVAGRLGRLRLQDQ
jgi:hypothetical protein